MNPNVRPMLLTISLLTALISAPDLARAENDGESLPPVSVTCAAIYANCYQRASAGPPCSLRIFSPTDAKGRPLKTGYVSGQDYYYYQIAFLTWVHQFQALLQNATTPYGQAELERYQKEEKRPHERILPDSVGSGAEQMLDLIGLMISNPYFDMALVPGAIYFGAKAVIDSLKKNSWHQRVMVGEVLKESEFKVYDGPGLQVVTDAVNKRGRSVTGEQVAQFLTANYNVGGPLCTLNKTKLHNIGELIDFVNSGMAH